MRCLTLVSTAAAVWAVLPVPVAAEDAATIFTPMRTLPGLLPPPAALFELSPAAEAEPLASVSCGHANRGRLYGGVALPDAGPGFVVPEPWRSRPLRYGTEELVSLIQRAAAALASEYPDAVLGVADLSLEQGGQCPRHKSHESGRDVDLLYFATDAEGVPVPPDPFMPHFGRRGIARTAKSPEWLRSIPERRLDIERNWQLVKALITDEQVEVARIFVAPDIERALIAHARERGEDEELVKRAAVRLLDPGRGESHTDHLHVRVGCSARDVERGFCRTELARDRRIWRAPCPHPTPLPRLRS